MNISRVRLPAWREAPAIDPVTDCFGVVRGARRRRRTGDRQLRERQRTRQRTRKVLRLPGRRSRRVRPKPISLAPPSPTLKGASGSPIFSSAGTKSSSVARDSRNATRRLNLTVGSAFDFPIALKLEAVAESVTVTGTATVPRIGAQPDRRDRLTDRSRPAAAQRAELPRRRPSRAWRLADKRRRHSYCSLKRQPSQVTGLSIGSQRNFRTDSSSTACRLTTMLRASAACPTVVSTRSISFRWSRREGRPSSVARSAAT